MDLGHEAYSRYPILSNVLDVLDVLAERAGTKNERMACSRKKHLSIVGSVWEDARDTIWENMTSREIAGLES